jgi:hypothetical protein
MNKLKMEEVRPLLKLAIEEDLGLGDMTSELLFGKNVSDEADIISREEIVVCGMDVVKELLRMYDRRIKLKVLVKDGQHDGAAAFDTYGGAGSAQFPAAAVRDSDNDAEIRACGAGDKSEDLRYAKDDAGLACAGEIRGAVRRGI